MRICFLSRRVFPTISGMSVYALNLARQLAAQGHGVTLLGEHYGGEAAAIYGSGPPAPIPGVRAIGMESVGEQTSGDFEADIEALVRRVEAEHALAPFDILHAQYGYPTGYAALEAGRRTGVPVVVSIQGGDGHWVGDCCNLHRRAMQTVLEHAGAVLIGSESFAQAVSARLGVAIERLTVVPGAVDTERFQPDGRDRARLGEPPRLLYHGRIDRRKGVLDLLDALAVVRETRDVRLVLSGIGPDVDAAQARTEALGLTDAVETLGIASYAEAPQRYHTGDVFVSPTYAEGFSNTILEAMASGLPAVSCVVVGVVDCLTHEHNALLVPPADPPALAAAISRMLDDDRLRERLAATALAEARTLYAWTARAEQIADVYTSLIGTAPSTDWTYETNGAEPCVYRQTPHLL